MPTPLSLLLRTSLVGALGLLISACNSLSPTATSVQIAPKPYTPSVALVLGGGGAKGFAHVGVIKALEESGITPTLVVGTSVGSLVGSLYASGYTSTQLEQLALTTPDSALTDFTLSNQGFIEGIKLKNFINAKVGGRPIEAFPITFAAIAAEKDTLIKAVFTEGDAGLAVQASCSVPNIFIAPRIPVTVGKKYIDGGVVSLVPVDSARDLGADIVIAVDVTDISAGSSATALTINKLPAITSLGSFWGLLEYNLAANINGNATTNTSSRHERQRADIVITPNVSHISSLDTSQRRALISAGVQATTPQINAIKQLITDKSKSKYTTL
ncbi:patatin-like phospholipase family protein [Psychrobacter frigidicola]|uniref:Patatin-like phospholipase family protein n=1 Tax=Psychrobacter frigidicola TaxID=45611 RepID=A0A5C7A394_9GAMM|nr:patatin-like phospholipase family protein [Psychrobacter frigidicola]TXD96282.1 patatin-like phospholipase family protein [Psychrobacter frigidicola]